MKLNSKKYKIMLLVSVSLIIAFLVLGNVGNFVTLNTDGEYSSDKTKESPIANIIGASEYSIYINPTLEVPHSLTGFGLAVDSYPAIFSSATQLSIIPFDKSQKRRQLAIFNLQRSQQIISGFSRDEPTFFINGLESTLDLQNLDVHDVILHEDKSVTLLKQLPDLQNNLIHLRIEKISAFGNLVWSWMSADHIDSDWYVGNTAASPLANTDTNLWDYLKTTRQYISYVLHIYVPFLADIGSSVRLFDRTVVSKKRDLTILKDYVHANSIQYFDKDKKIIVSAKHLDTIFVIDIKTGKIVWALGGSFSKMTKNRPIGDPRGGFSNQHTARIFNNKLYVFDNANLYSLPSRAVVYKIDKHRLDKAQFIFQFLEPNRLMRGSMGSVLPINNEEILIGWGGVQLADRHKITAAVSVVNISKNFSFFQMNFKPGWTSYRSFTDQAQFKFINN